MRKIITAALFGTMVFLAFIMGVQGALLTDTINYFHPESSAQGFASLAASFGGMAAFVSAFFLIGRISKMHLLEIGILVSCVFLCGLAVSKTYVVFIAVWFAVGIGLGYMDTLLSSCIADLYTGKEATRMMCNLHTTYGVSSMIAPVIYSAMKSAGVQWNHIYYFVSALGLLMLAVMFIVGKKTAEATESAGAAGLAGAAGEAGEGGGSSGTVRTENRLSLREMTSLICSGRLPYLIAAIFTHGLFLGGLNSWLTHYVSVTLAGKLGGIALSFLFLGVLVSRFCFPLTGIDTMKYLSKAGLLSGVILALALLFSNDVIVCAGAALCALSFGAMIPCMLNEACVDLPQSTLLATTAMMLSLYLGQGLASPILGAFEKGIGLRYGMYFCAVNMILTSLILSSKKMKTD